MSATPPPTARPNPLQMIFHIGRTTRLTGALLRDPRISIFRKLFFLLCIAALVVVVILPADVTQALLESVLPFVGPLLGIPADIAVDWVAAAVAGYNLLRIFPPEIVGEHYDRLFRGGVAASPPTPQPQISAPLGSKK